VLLPSAVDAASVKVSVAVALIAMTRDREDPAEKREKKKQKSAKFVEEFLLLSSTSPSVL
jgi:hypothetical protein